MRCTSGAKGRYGGKEKSEMPTASTATSAHPAHRNQRGRVVRPGPADRPEVVALVHHPTFRSSLCLPHALDRIPPAPSSTMPGSLTPSPVENGAEAARLLPTAGRKLAQQSGLQIAATIINAERPSPGTRANPQAIDRGSPATSPLAPPGPPLPRARRPRIRRCPRGCRPPRA